jgi:hypothetical protein
VGLLVLFGNVSWLFIGYWFDRICLNERDGTCMKVRVVVRILLFRPMPTKNEFFF